MSEKRGGYGVKYLDEEACFYLWAELGSLAKAAQELARRGMINPKSGNKPTRASVSIAATRWLADNLREGYEVYLKCGSLMSWEDFKKWAVGYVKRVKSRSSYRRWLKKNNLMEYDPEYANAYPTLEAVEQDQELQQLKEIYERLNQRASS